MIDRTKNKILIAECMRSTAKALGSFDLRTDRAAFERHKVLLRMLAQVRT